MIVANGATGTRGSLQEGSPASTPATFVAGVFGDDTGELQHPPAGHGARLALRAAAGRRHAAEPDQRRDRRAPPGARHEPGHRLSLLAPARPRGAHGARAHGALRLAGRPRDHGPARRSEPRRFLRAPQSGRPAWASRTPVVRSTTPRSPRSTAAALWPAPRGARAAVTYWPSTKPALGSPVARYLEQSRDVIGGRLDCEMSLAMDRHSRRGVLAQPAADHAAALNVLEKAETAGFDELLRATSPPGASAGTTPLCRSAATRTPSSPCASRCTT